MRARSVSAVYVHQYADLECARSRLREGKAAVDVLLSKLSLPGASVAEAIEHLSAHLREVMEISPRCVFLFLVGRVCVFVLSFSSSSTVPMVECVCTVLCCR